MLVEKVIYCKSVKVLDFTFYGVNNGNLTAKGRMGEERILTNSVKKSGSCLLTVP